MAVDDALIECATSGQDPGPILHFYRKTRSISLGYFQSVSTVVNVQKCDQYDVGIFRRTSGGGAIFEDEGQLIYGLILPEPDAYGVPPNTLESFDFINRAMVHFIEGLGLDANFVPVNDVEVGGRKISGCAQTRRKGSLLQHGTLIIRYDPGIMFEVLKIDPEKIRSKGLSDAADRVTSLERELGYVPELTLIKEQLRKSFSSVLDIDFQDSGLSVTENDRVEKLILERYTQKEWNFMRP